MSKRPTYTPVTDIAGSKRDAEQLRERERQRQKEVKAALIADMKANPRGYVVSSPKTAPKKKYERVTSRQRPPDEGDQEPLRTLPRPSIRPDNTKLIPSKPERGNATVKPPRLSKSERDAVTLQKTLAGTKWAEMQQPGKRKKRVTQSRSPAAVQRTSTIWEGEKSEDILDSRARLAGSAFSGKRGR